MNPIGTPLRAEKIGGDNVTDLRGTLELLQGRREREVGVYVLSAFREEKPGFNTTSYLMEAGEACKRGDKETTLRLLSEVRDFYIRVLERELPDNKDVQGFCLGLFRDYERGIHTYFENKNLFYFPHNGTWYKNFEPERANDYSIPAFSILGIGEVATAKIYDYLLGGNSLVHTETDPMTPKNIGEIRDSIGSQAETLLDTQRIILVPGFIGRLREGILKTWDRGYSDPALGAVTRALIERSISGKLKMLKDVAVCSADPRIVGRDKVQILRNPSLALILEMVKKDGADAGFINEFLLDPALFVNGGTLHLYSPDDQVGSTITLNGEIEKEGIESILIKEVYAFTIVSYRYDQIGYGEQIARFFREKGLSFAESPGSNSSLTYTVNKKEFQKTGLNPEEVCKEFEMYVQRFENDEEPKPSVSVNHRTTLHLVGEKLDYHGILHSVTGVLTELAINIYFVSQPDKTKAIILGVDPSRGAEAVKALHSRLIEVRN